MALRLSVVPIAVLMALGLAEPVGAAGLRAGVGRADITPKTGYYLGGWTRADRVSKGQHTRLHASALVLERDGRKVALVAIDLFAAPAGLVKHVADRNRDRGFSEQNVLVSASHTHSGPGGYANFETFNTAAPSLQTATDPFTFYELLDPKPADRQLYTFLVQQIGEAIRRADDDRGRAVAGWGSEEIHGLTKNRSIEAHLANHGKILERGQGRPEQDPDGVAHTIDPAVNVLRVDKLKRKRVRCKRRGRKGRRRGRRHCTRRVRVPIGGWSNFAIHGTVTKSSFPYYNQDHHASALRRFEARIKRPGKSRRWRQEVVNVYGNSNEGDQSAGLVHHGPAGSDHVGKVEGRAMLRAWRLAGRRLSRNPPVDVRWTRVCFCGQRTEGGNVGDSPFIGTPFLTGSEEERGPLHDVTGAPLEGARNPTPTDSAQGHKAGIPLGEGVPKAVPLLVVRVGSRMIASMPGEPTAEMGRQVRASVLRAASPAGVHGVVVAGLANEFIQYFTTPAEYDRQHYEGGSMLFGRLAGTFLRVQLGELARRLVNGQPAQGPYPFDSTNGVVPNGPPYGSGAADGEILAQPRSAYRRLQRAELSWQGGREGLDRPVDRAFVVAERRKRGRWVPVASDLGVAMLWSVDPEGRYRVRWEIPLEARRGIHRLVVRAKRYRLVSRSFRIRPSGALSIRQLPSAPGRVVVALRYPQPIRDVDLTQRPDVARGGMVVFRVGRRRVKARRQRLTVFSTRAVPGRPVAIAPRAARDRHGNFVATGTSLRN